MFDVSFGELLLILIVGLLVLGPDKLPQAVRTASLWLARLRRSFNQIRADIEREVGVDELKRDLHNQALLDSLHDVRRDLTDAQREIEQLPYEVDQRTRDNIRLAREQAAGADHGHDDAAQAGAAALEAQARAIEDSVRAPDAPGARIEADPAARRS